MKHHPLTITLASFLLALSEAHAAEPRVSFELNGQSVQFQTTLHTWLEGILREPGTTRPTTPPPACPERERELRASEASRCSAWQARAGEWNAGRGLCSRILDPLGDLLRIQPRIPDFADTADLERMIEVAGVPLAQMGVPAVFRTPEMKAGIERIITKVRFESYARELSRQRALMEELLSGQAAASGCFTELQLAQLRGPERELHAAAELLRRVQAESGAPSPGLPYPLLSAQERELTSAILGAFAWRVRGGSVYLESSWVPQSSRLKWVRNPFNLIARLNGGDAVDGTGTRLMLPLLTGGYSKYFDMGHMPGHKGDNGTLAEDFANMTRVGERFVAQAAEYIRGAGFAPEELEFAGRQIAPCYLYAWDALVPRKASWGRTDMPEPLEKGLFAAGPLTWGELCYGAGLGLGLARSLRHHR